MFVYFEVFHDFHTSILYFNVSRHLHDNMLHLSHSSHVSDYLLHFRVFSCVYRNNWILFRNLETRLRATGAQNWHAPVSNWRATGAHGPKSTTKRNTEQTLWTFHKHQWPPNTQTYLEIHKRINDEILKTRQDLERLCRTKKVPPKTHTKTTTNI